ncbi:MAG: rod shape-determining protein MreC [Bacteroidia bacterium]|nr:rod shape-determining protein MreC [Bacteroidia bacterium]MDW8235126.1 rod shape-determining protein MreC [Bacteroidia bacterium]
MGLPLWLRLLARPPVLWLFLQSAALYFFFTYNPTPAHRLERWLLGLSASIHEIFYGLARPWLALSEVERLRKMNEELLNALATIPFPSPPLSYPLAAWGDFTAMQKYRFIAAEVVYQTIHHRANYAILNKGGQDGVYPGLSVVGHRGIVGVIAETTATYSVMYSVLHRDVHVAVTLPRHQAVGFTTWSTPTLNELHVEYIPLYISVEVGEEVWTSSNSLIFPGRIRVGVVERIESDFTQGFHEVIVRTYEDWQRLGTVFILCPAS